MSQHALKIANFCTSILVAVLLIFGISSIDSSKNSELKSGVSFEKEDAEIQSKINASAQELLLDSGSGEDETESRRDHKNVGFDSFLTTSLNDKINSTNGCLSQASTKHSPFYILYCSLKLDTVTLL